MTHGYLCGSGTRMHYAVKCVKYVGVEIAQNYRNLEWACHVVAAWCKLLRLIMFAPLVFIFFCFSLEGIGFFPERILMMTMVVMVVGQ